MPRELSEFIQRLKEQYSKNPDIERLFYPESPLPLASCYLSLALIQDKKIKVSSASVKEKEPETESDSKEIELEDKMRIHFLHEYERILHIQEKIEITQIPIQCKQSPERIFIEGAAGAGKSTLCRYIAYEWSQNSRTWEKYTWVFYIRLRDLTEGRYPKTEISLIDVIEKECFQFGESNQLSEREKKRIQKYIRKNSNKVLLVLDGYDELTINQPKIKAFWEDLMHSDCSILITARPATTMVPNNISFETRLAALGFNDEQVEIYIQKFFDPAHTPNVKPEQALDCLKALKANLNLWNLAHTPIQLELLCSIWEDTLKADIDFSHAKIYRLITEKLLSRYEMHQNNQEEKVVDIEDTDNVPKNAYTSYLEYMEYLAFLGMTAREINLNKAQIREAYEKTLPEVKRKEKSFKPKFFKELKELGVVKRNSEGTQAEFLHLTFQEYFAARYVAKSIKAFCEHRTEGLKHSVLLDFVRDNKWDPFYSIMWWFVSGVLGDTSTHAANYEQYLFQERHLSENELPIPESHKRLQVLQTFFDLLLQEPRTEVEFEEVILLSKCLEEAKIPCIIQKNDIVKHMRIWWEFYDKKKQTYDLSHTRLELLEKILISSPNVLTETQITKEWIKQLNNKNSSSSEKRVIIHKLTALQQTTFEVLSVLIRLLSDKDWQIRIKAAESLGYLKQVTPEVLSALIKALSDKYWSVQSTAAESLGHLNQATPKVLSALTKKALSNKDKSWSVRMSAAKSLVDLNLVISEVVSMLMENALSNQYWPIQIDAIELLGQLHQVTPEVISTLIKTLSDENLNVRMKAVESLINLNQVVPEVISTLVHALSNENERIRINAAKWLGYLKQETPEIISALMAALSDDDRHVRRKIAESIGHLNQAIAQALSSLLKAISPEQYWMMSREHATELLGYLNQATPEVLSALMMALVDQQRDIRMNAAKSFGRLNHVAPEIISALKGALSDQYSEVQIKAAKSLIQLNHITPEVISILVITLSDVNWRVQRKAARLFCHISQIIPEVLLSALPTLTKALSDMNKHVRMYATESVGFLNQTTPKILSSLTKGLSDTDTNVKWKSVKSLIQLKQTKTLFDKIFPEQPFRIPPSRLIHKSENTPANDTQKNLQILELCGNSLLSIINTTENRFLLFEQFWTLAIIRKKENTSTYASKTDLRFFKSPSNNLSAQAFLVIEGIQKGVHFAKKIDFYSFFSDHNQSNSQRIKIEISNLIDFKRLSKLASNCYCMVQNVSREMIEEKLVPSIQRDMEAAERGKIKYRLTDDDLLSPGNKTRHQYSSISWYLEKWQELELPIQQKWTDLLVVSPTQPLQEDSNENYCMIM